MSQEQLHEYKYRGARALVLLHEIHLKSCLDTWREAKSLNINLPATDDEDYQSLDILLRHVLRSARGYIVWMCENLNLPDPEIDNTPEPDSIEDDADEYLSHLLEKWRLPLADLPKEVFHQSYTSRWGIDYCIDAMLEHAVMHPIRHEFQLRTLIDFQIK